MMRYLSLVLFITIVLTGCGSGRAYQILQSDIQQVDASIGKLRVHLQSNRMGNAIRLQQYGLKLAELDPSLADLAAALSLEATADGALFKSLVERLDEFKQTAPPEGSSSEQIRAASKSLELIYLASSSDEFNRALADPVNVLADLSQGRLPRVDAISAQTETGVGMEPGTQLVGNPHYGSWQSSSGGSFWVWYGQYALLRDVLGGRRYGYGNWSRDRRYSYYHDYGRGTYSSPKQLQTQRGVQTQAAQKFSREGKTFTSPYARTRTGASRQVARVKTPRRATTASSRSHNKFSSRSGSRGK